MVSKTKKQNIKLLIIAGILIGIFGAALTTNSSVTGPRPISTGVIVAKMLMVTRNPTQY